MMFKRSFLGVLAAAVLFGCGGTTTDSGVSGQAFLLLSNGSLRRIRLSDGGFVGLGITPSVSLESIAVNPQTDQLLGFGTDTKLYSVNSVSGACTPISVNPTNLSTNGAGMSVDPATGNVRYVTADDDNFLISSTTGAVIATDTDFEFEDGDPHDGDALNLVGCAYEANTSAFFAVDGINDVLVRTNAVATGQVETVGPVGVVMAGSLGFSIDQASGFGYLVFDVGAASGLYRVNLATGVATPVQLGLTAEDIAVIP